MSEVVVTKITEIIYFLVPLAIAIAAIIFWQEKQTKDPRLNKKRDL